MSVETLLLDEEEIGPTERSGGNIRHSFAQGRITAWFIQRNQSLRLDALPELCIQLSSEKVRVADIVISELPLPEEEVFTSPPYLCIEIMSPEDTMASLQDRIDDYFAFGVPNVWVIDPWKNRGWIVSSDAWIKAVDGIMRTSDNRVAMPLADVLLP